MEYKNLTLQDIEKALQSIDTKQKPLFKVSKVSWGMYKVECGDKSILCSDYFLLELDSAIRKEFFYNPEIKTNILPNE